MVGTMTLFFQVVGFSHAVVLAPLTRCFPNITKSYNFRLSVFLSVRTVQFVAQYEEFHEI
jgi:hypothetical protein